MALNPEIVANVLQIQLNHNCVGDWYRNGQTAFEIEAKARERATSPESFTDWLVRQMYFELRSGILLYDFKQSLIEQLLAADLTVVSESVRTSHHEILIIESEKDQVRNFKSFLLRYAKNKYGIADTQVVVSYLSYPPESAAFVELLTQHSGAVLHNLSLGDLITINDAVINTPELARKLVVVMTGGSRTPEHDRLYSELKTHGVMVIRKPIPSREEVFRVLLGIV